MGNMNRSLRLPSLTIGILVLALAGCGSKSKSSSTTTSGSSTTTTGGTPSVQASTRLPETAQAWAKAVSAHDCNGIAAVALAAHVTSTHCQALETALPKPSVGKTAGYGTGGVADVTLANKRNEVVVFLKGAGGTWRYLTQLASSRAVVGSPPAGSKRGSAIVGEVLGGIAAGSCAHIAGDLPIVKTTSSTRTPANCLGHTGTPLQTLLKRGFSAAKLLGGNARITFYSVGIGAKGKQRAFTALLIAEKGTPRFLGVYPGPVAGSKSKSKSKKASSS
jgi:hypothetical protein